MRQAGGDDLPSLPHLRLSGLGGEGNSRDQGSSEAAGEKKHITREQRLINI